MTEYEKDAYAWAMETAAAIRNRQLDQVNWEAVAEEIESMGRWERRAIHRGIDRIIEHLIKLEIGPWCAAGPQPSRLASNGDGAASQTGKAA